MPLPGKPDVDYEEGRGEFSYYSSGDEDEDEDEDKDEDEDEDKECSSKGA